MTMANVNFRMDSSTKSEMENICSELGMTMTTAFNIFAKKVVREKRIPFELSVDPFYSEANIKHLEKLAKDASLNQNMHEHELLEAD